MKLHIADRLAELPYRLRPPVRADALTWSLTPDQLRRVRIVWPTNVDWLPSANIVETQKASLSRLGVLDMQDTTQDQEGVILLHCTVDERPHLVVLDYSDYPDFVNSQALGDCSLYLKMEHAAKGYSDPRILPAGYSVTGLDYYRYYARYRERFANHRQFDVVGRFGFQFQETIRRKAVQLLSDAPDIDYVGAGGKVRYSRFLREVASARLCLHMPGNGPFTHRVAEFLGLGSCMVSIRFTASLHVPLEPGVHYVEVADDLSNLVETCRHYLASDDEREQIARNGSELFDRYVHSDQLAAYYLRTIIDRLGAAESKR